MQRLFLIFSVFFMACTPSNQPDLQTQVILNPLLPQTAEVTCETAERLKNEQKTDIIEYRLAKTQCDRQKNLQKALQTQNNTTLNAQDTLFTRNQTENAMKNILEEVERLEWQSFPASVVIDEQNEAQNRLFYGELNDNSPKNVTQMLQNARNILLHELQPLSESICTKQDSKNLCPPK